MWAHEFKYNSNIGSGNKKKKSVFRHQRSSIRLEEPQTFANTVSFDQKLMISSVQKQCTGDKQNRPYSLNNFALRASVIKSGDAGRLQDQ